MAKKRSRRASTASQEKLTIRRGKRHHFVIISVLVALSSLALVLAGFLSYSVPSSAPSATPTVTVVSTPLGAAPGSSGGLAFENRR